MRRVLVFLFLGLGACGGEPSAAETGTEDEETGVLIGCPEGGRRVALGYVDETGEAWVRLFIDFDGDGLGSTPGEALEVAGPETSGFSAVGWLDERSVLFAGDSEVFVGRIDESFESVAWEQLAALPGEEADNALLAGFVATSAEPGEAWALFDLPWTPQLVRASDAGLELHGSLDAGVLGDGLRWLSRVDGRWLVSDPVAGALWDFGEDFSDGTKLVDAQSVAWLGAELGTRPLATVSLGQGSFALQDDGEGALIYVLQDADLSGSIDPQTEVDLLIEPGICHRPRPRHLAALGERVIWVDDCEGTLIQERPGEVSEQRWFSLPGMALLHPDAVSVGIAGWNADCLVEP